MKINQISIYIYVHIELLYIKVMSRMLLKRKYLFSFVLETCMQWWLWIKAATTDLNGWLRNNIMNLITKHRNLVLD